MGGKEEEKFEVVLVVVIILDEAITQTPEGSDRRSWILGPIE